MSTRLRGHVPGWAIRSRDRGAVSSNTELNMTFVLSRSPELQAQFEKLLADQQNVDSPRYHQWLTPQQVGEQYGPTQHDLDALSGWFVSQGLVVKEIAPSGLFVHVSGPASSFEAALGVDLHYFEKSGTLHLSPIEEPAIPAALAPIVASISGIAEVEIRPQHHVEVRSLAETANAGGIRPQMTVNGNHFLVPGDLATIFDINSVYSSGLNGAGQKVAVIGRSRVAASDITAFESKTGLANNLPNTVIPTNGVDPGMTNDGDQIEATLDVQRVISAAPRAQVDLVVSGHAGNYDGLYLAAQYEVQTLLDPVMNISFGGCEGYSGVSSVALWDALFSQAASEGISVFVSSGDSGAAECNENGAVVPATQFLSINEICSSSYATCVGGTQFNDLSFNTSYWTNINSSNLASAIGYIPEGAWNEPTYVSSLGGYVGAGTGGGASVYVPKPSWQTGTGVPADHARDVPDISFPSAGHDGYFTCFAAAGGDCASNYFLNVGGTSNAAPLMAGIAAILNQKLGGAQGNLNPMLYRLAASAPNAFHDTTPASSGVSNCTVSIPSLCNNSTPSATSTLGGQAGYALTTGYDLATGLGSLDVANFLSAAASVSRPSGAATTLVVRGSATTITNTQTVTFTATVSANAATGTVQFYANGNALGAPVAVSSGAATTAALPFSAAGTYYITAMYSGDSNYAASTAPGFTLVVTGLTSTTSVTASSTSIPVGTTVTFSTTVAGPSGSPTPTGSVRFLVVGANYADYVATVSLVNGTATTPMLRFPTIGSYTVTARYLGDSVYSPSTSVSLPYSVTRLSATVSLSSSGSIGVGGGSVFGMYINTAVSTIGMPAPTGTVQLYSNGVALGAPVSVTGNQSFSPPEIFSIAGTFSITASYSGDAYRQPSTSAAINQTVLSQPASFQMTHTTSTLSLTAGAKTANTDTVNVISSLGFTGTVNLACSITSNSGAAANPPTCLISNPSQALGPNGVPLFQSTVTIGSTARPLHTASAEGTDLWGHLGKVSACVLALWLFPMRRRRSWRALAIALVSIAGMAALSGCGGGGSGGGSPTPPPPAGTTAGSYTVTISATTTAVGITPPPPVTIALTIN
ncbi:Ig-like domain repeat protein [Edaphobacter flagellatus]|uniref:Ig-like domain repeat protein n=1 Tax=Edaphobacter flagellatus TaxID=1933044 RepID=UPI0021B33356|nr:Ig-like domain repeat protein [Edaphobacter flagellatus]